MKISIVILTVFVAGNVFAKEKKHEHREHGAHVHGGGQMAIAFEGAKGKIEFKGAAEGILGFEHKPKNKKDEKIVADAAAAFEKNISKLVQFSPSLECRFAKEMVGQVPEEGEESSGEHSDWVANFEVNCAKSPEGTKVTIDFGNYKNIKDLDVTLLVGSVQKSAEYKGKPMTVELK